MLTRKIQYLTLVQIAAVSTTIHLIASLSYTHGDHRESVLQKIFDPSRMCWVKGNMHGCSAVEGAAVSSGNEPAPDAKCLSGNASWGACNGGRFLCEMGDVKGTDISPPAELQFSETGPSFCSFDSTWWVCLEISSKLLNYPIAMRAFDCLDGDWAKGICNDGESLCLLPGGTWLEMYVPIVSREASRPNIHSTDDLSTLFLANTRSQSGEDKYAWKNFFYGKTHGSFLEMGALDGELFSNSWAFERALNWSGVLIEANPAMLRRIKAKRPAQRVVSAAICEKETVVDFVFPESSGSERAAYGAVGGLPQYLTKEFLANHYGDRKVTRQKVACVPMMQILDGLGARDFDLFSLDVEGAELAVLRTIDFARVRIDVVCVEANGHNPEKDAAVRSLLASAGYTYHSGHGGSDWFTARGFVPSAALQT